MPQPPVNTANRFWLPLVGACILIVGILLGIKLQREIPIIPSVDGKVIRESHPGKIEELLRYIEARYVDKIDRDELTQKVINNILKELDPHSTYISADQLQKVNEQLDGNFEGIGIEFLIIEDTIVVIKPTENGPSDKAGIQAGDKIVSVGDSLIVGDRFHESTIIDSLRGEKGSKVKVGIVREGHDEVLYFEVTRGEIPINSVDAAYMLSQNTGYIKINRFSSTTHTEFLDHLTRMIEEEHLENVVIDVRDNPGGYLQEATSILNQFFEEKDKLLVYTEGHNVHRSDYETTGRAFFNIDNVVVLVDEGSASASEILAGAIQDYDRGIIIGRRSFGKGLVQEQYSLKDGSAIRLTVARYYTPSGRSIQRNYDNPDVYDNEIEERLNNGELYSGQQDYLADTAQYYTQDGRIVYGGGGIIPDIFVPLDSTKSSPYFSQIQPYIRSFIYKYYLNNKPRLDGSDADLRLTNLEDYLDNYEISEEVYYDFTNSIEDAKLSLQASKINQLKPTTKLYLKARLAKHLFDDNGLYAVLNREDDAVRKALQVLAMPNPISVLAEE